MNSDNDGKKFFKVALLASCLMHLLILAALFMIEKQKPVSAFKPLAVMDFSSFDPEGGTPGGGDQDEGEEMAEASSTETASTEPEPPAEPEPEPPTPEPVEEPKVVESTAEKAAPAPKAPPVKKNKTPPKPAAGDSQAASADKNGSSGPAAGSGEPGSGRGGSGEGSGQGNPNALKAYIAKINKKLARNKKYPSAARAQRLEGVATVNFNVDRQGVVSSPRLVQSSGHSLLDEEALALLRRASPFPAMPKEMSQDSLNLTVPIQFSLK